MGRPRGAKYHQIDQQLILRVDYLLWYGRFPSDPETVYDPPRSVSEAVHRTVKRYWTVVKRGGADEKFVITRIENRLRYSKSFSGAEARVFWVAMRKVKSENQSLMVK
jgi:hypothetical protein